MCIDYFTNMIRYLECFRILVRLETIHIMKTNILIYNEVKIILVWNLAFQNHLKHFVWITKIKQYIVRQSDGVRFHKG